MTPEAHIGLAVFYIVLTLFFVSLRFWALRHFRKQRDSIASYVCSGSIILAAVTYVVTLSINMWLLALVMDDQKAGTVLPSLDVGPKNAILELKMLYFDRLSYYVIIWLVKLGFLSLYFDIASHTASKLMWWFLYGISGMTAATFLINFFISAFWCLPISRCWDLQEVCNPFHHLDIVSAQFGTNVATDLLIMTVPIRLLQNLHLSRREWVGVTFIVVVGCITILVSCFRYAFLYVFITGNLSSSPQNTLYITSEAEMFLAIFAICLPAFRVFLRSHRGEPSRQNHDHRRRFFWTTKARSQNAAICEHTRVKNATTALAGGGKEDMHRIRSPAVEDSRLTTHGLT